MIITKERQRKVEEGLSALEEQAKQKPFINKKTLIFASAILQCSGDRLQYNDSHDTVPSMGTL